jgi:hypothetical protein
VRLFQWDRDFGVFLIAADAGRLLLTLAIPVVSLLHGPTLTVIYIVIVPLVACSALFESASATAVPVLVPEDERGLAGMAGQVTTGLSVVWLGLAAPARAGTNHVRHHGRGRRVPGRLGGGGAPAIARDYEPRHTRRGNVTSRTEPRVSRRRTCRTGS